jgi:hypothetical protein
MIAGIVILVLSACARPPFDRYLAEEKWSDAARAFAADPSLLYDERSLYQAGLLYSSPERGEYDPARARSLFRRLLVQFPESRYRVDAADRLALIDTVLSQRDSVAVREHDLEARIAALTVDVRRLRSSLDSAVAHGDTVQRSLERMSSDLRERDEQLRALRLELTKLKAIDLKPRPPGRPPTD